MKQMRLGEFLVKYKYIAEDQLEHAMKLQRERKERIGRLLVELGYIDEQDLVSALAEHAGFDRADPRRYDISADLLEIISEDNARRLNVLPLERSGDQEIRVAMSNPFDMEAIRDMEFLFGKGIEPVICTDAELGEAIERNYGVDRQLNAMLSTISPETEKEKVRMVDADMDKLKARLKKGGIEPYVDLLNYLLAKAVEFRGSDIHLEPQEDSLRVRFRIDGILREVMNLPKWVERGLISRIKVVGEMDVSNRLDPQDGRAQVQIGEREKDLRISTVPSHYGEKCVARILDADILTRDLQTLGLTPEELSVYYFLISQPQGMILVVGPTGSGKSTTLYATINRLRSEQASIVTVEDPIEYDLSGITQTQVNEKREFTFSRSIRWLLRQDPDVMIIGEIRDSETASAAFQAALTGHLVFSTLHTPDTVSAITRLRDLGVPPYLTGAALLGIVAQRLVRRLCNHCKRPGKPEDAEWQKLGLSPVALPNYHVAGPGCPACMYSAYHDRMGVFEILSIDDEIRELIHNEADESEIRAYVSGKKLKTLLSGAVQKAGQGITTLGEISRVIGSASAQALLAGQLEAADYGQKEAAPLSEVAPPGTRDQTEPETKRAEAAASGASGEAQHEPHQKNILVVDDSQEILDMLAFTLEGEDFHVLTAADGKSALDIINKHIYGDPIHLVVLDVMMPDMSGFEVADELRKDVTTAFLPILMLSARGDQEHIKKGLRSGADDYLPKPFDPEELELRIRALLRRAYGNDQGDPE